MRLSLKGVVFFTLFSVSAVRAAEADPKPAEELKGPLLELYKGLDTAEAMIAKLRADVKESKAISGEKTSSAKTMVEACKAKFAFHDMLEVIKKSWIPADGAVRGKLPHGDAYTRLMDEVGPQMTNYVSFQMCQAEKTKNPQCSLASLVAVLPEKEVGIMQSSCNNASAVLPHHGVLRAIARGLPDAQKRCEDWLTGRLQGTPYREVDRHKTSLCKALMAHWSDQGALCAEALAQPWGKAFFPTPEHCAKLRVFPPLTGECWWGEPNECENFRLFAKTLKAGGEKACGANTTCHQYYDTPSEPGTCNRHIDRISDWYCGLYAKPDFAKIVEDEKGESKVKLAKIESEKKVGIREQVGKLSELLSNDVLVLNADPNHGDAWKKVEKRLRGLLVLRDQVIKEIGDPAPKGKAQNKTPGAPPPGKPSGTP